MGRYHRAFTSVPSSGFKRASRAPVFGVSMILVCLKTDFINDYL